MSISDNIALAESGYALVRLVWNRRPEEGKEMVDHSAKALKIRMSGAQVDAGSLSGGNQQKVVVAKWLARNSRLLF